MGPPIERCCDVHEVEKDLLIHNRDRKDPFNVSSSRPTAGKISPPGSWPPLWRSSSEPPHWAPSGRSHRRQRRPGRHAGSRRHALCDSRIARHPHADHVPVPSVVVLDTVDDNDPRLAIDDQTGSLRSVVPGHAGDGMSTRWNTAIVDQVDANSIRVTWVGFPGEEQVGLTITADGGAPVLVFDQKAPYANTDALGADRVLGLTFDPRSTPPTSR